MISFIKGKNIEISPTKLIVDVNGVGYEILISLRTYSKIKNIDKVNIYYSYDNGENWSIIAKNIDNTGEYSWPIPKNIKSSNKCLI